MNIKNGRFIRNNTQIMNKETIKNAINYPKKIKELVSGDLNN
jgi:hypothetical protein